VRRERGLTIFAAANSTRPPPLAFRYKLAYDTLYAFSNLGIDSAGEFTKNLLDFENAFPIIWRKRAPVRLSAMRTVKPGPDAFGGHIFSATRT
jgi:hypothetical protein